MQYTFYKFHENKTFYKMIIFREIEPFHKIVRFYEIVQFREIQKIRKMYCFANLRSAESSFFESFWELSYQRMPIFWEGGIGEGQAHPMRVIPVFASCRDPLQNMDGSFYPAEGSALASGRPFSPMLVALI